MSCFAARTSLLTCLLLEFRVVRVREKPDLKKERNYYFSPSFLKLCRYPPANQYRCFIKVNAVQNVFTNAEHQPVIIAQL